MSVVNVLVLLLCIIVLSERCASLKDKIDLLDNVNVPVGAAKTKVCKKKLIRTRYRYYRQVMVIRSLLAWNYQQPKSQMKIPVVFQN